MSQHHLHPVSQVPFQILPEALMHRSPLQGLHYRNGAHPPQSTIYCISLPANEITMAYAGWYSSLGLPGYGIWMEPQTTWEASYSTASLEALMTSLLERGYPTAVWMMVQETDQGTNAWFLEKRE